MNAVLVLLLLPSAHSNATPTQVKSTIWLRAHPGLTDGA